MHVITMECLSCGNCSWECKQDAIFMGNVHYDVDPDKCTDCGECESVCPIDAIRQA